MTSRFLSYVLMAASPSAQVPLEHEPPDAALQHKPWRMRVRLSSLGDALEAFLTQSGFDRGPWLAVAFAVGIALWFVLPNRFEWVLAASAALMVVVGALATWRGNEVRVQLRLACVTLGLLVAGGIAVIWARSEMVGAEPIARPVVARIDARVLQRIEQPADGRVRLVLATREPGGTRAIKVRVNLPFEHDDPSLASGALVRLRVRLMPPAPPMLPGAYDFARTAWFAGIAATGSALGPVTVTAPGAGGGWRNSTLPSTLPVAASPSNHAARAKS